MCIRDRFLIIGHFGQPERLTSMIRAATDLGSIGAIRITIAGQSQLPSANLFEEIKHRELESAIGGPGKYHGQGSHIRFWQLKFGVQAKVFSRASFDQPKYGKRCFRAIIL